MKKRTSKKLALSRDTLGSLSLLKEAKGAVETAGATCSWNCNSGPYFHCFGTLGFECGT